MTDRTRASDLSRRSMIRCAALCGVAAPALAACGSGDGSAGAAEAAAGRLVAAADVPVGGGVILPDAGVVVTQPTRGSFRGFSDTCTHQGFTVSSVRNGVITCPKHGSQFAIDDGANVAGPNGKPAGSVPALPEVLVQVRRGQVVRQEG